MLCMAAITWYKIRRTKRLYNRLVLKFFKIQMSTTSTFGNNPIFTLVFGLLSAALSVYANSQSSIPSFIPNLLGAGFIASLLNIVGYFFNAPTSEDYNYDKAIQTLVVGGASGLVASGGAFAGINLSALTPVGALAVSAIIILIEWIIKGFKKGNLNF